MSGRVQEADGLELRAAIQSGRRVLVEFWAPWCIQCGPMASVVERVADELPADVTVLKVSVEDEAVATEHDVRGLPALYLYHRGEPVVQLSGFRRPPAILEELAGHLA